MTAVTYPGVYVEEVPGGARPIEAASTSTAAFVGVAEKGPDDRAVRITGWSEFQKQFGGFISSGHLAESVYQFFNNGGRQCYIVRVTGSLAAAATVTLPNRAGQAGLKLTASSKGAWGNSLFVWIQPGADDPGNTFRLSVYLQAGAQDAVNPDVARAATPLETFEGLSVDAASNDYYVKRIGESSAYLTAGRPLTTPEIRGYHLGKAVPSRPLDTLRKLLINLDDDGFQEVQLADGIASSTSLADIAAEIQRAVRLLTKKRQGTNALAFSQFECAVEPGADGERFKLTSGTTGAGSSVRVRPASTNNATGMLKIGDTDGDVSFGGLSNRIPRVGTYQVGDEPNVAPVVSEPGVDDNDIGGTQPYKDALSRLDKVTDVSLLAVPGIPDMFDPGVAYCENRPLRDIFFIGEMGQLDDTPAEAEAFRKQRIAKPNTYGALYFPWIKSPDPSGRRTEPVRMPPSGFVAGLCARIDGTRGVWKAPAGTEATISGAVGLTVELSDTEQGNLNRISVNCIRRFDLAGIVSWGARTVYSDPEYKYVPVRRTAIMLRKSIYDGIQWAVFEPNDHRLWAALRLNIGAFMNGLFRAGAFQGETTGDAYFVRCGLGDTMTQDDIDRGQAIVQVGFAPLKPAEFVIVRIQQKAGQP